MLIAKNADYHSPSEARVVLLSIGRGRIRKFFRPRLIANYV